MKPISPRHFVRRTSLAAFSLGWAACIGAERAYQDWIGKEAYLRLVDASWMDLHWLVGFTLLASASIILSWQIQKGTQTLGLSLVRMYRLAAESRPVSYSDDLDGGSREHDQG